VGGPTLNVLNLTKYLSPEFETLLVVGEKESHEKDASPLADKMGIQTVMVPEMGRSIHPVKDWRAYLKIKKIIADFKPDIVHTHAAKPGAVGRLAAANARVPVIVHTYHGHVFHSYFGKMKTRFIIETERWLAKKSGMLVAISEQQKNELANQFRIAAADHFRIIPLGFDLLQFSEDREEKRKKFREEFSLSDQEIAIGIIGRMVPVKNHGLFLQGISHVLKNSKKKIRAFIIGDGETRKSMEEKAKELGISFTSSSPFDPQATMVFTSWRSDIDVINAGLDIVALTSLNEGTPVSLIEAQAANKPVISTRVGGISDIVIEKETALLSDVSDVHAFEENLLRLVEDNALRNHMGKGGAEFVIKRYSVQRLASDMASLYRELLNGKNKKYVV
jgi:glycosyltransferase involved in cell wall biosynthesis